MTRCLTRTLALLLLLVPGLARAAEVCRFEGTTSHDGRVAVNTAVSGDGDSITVDVTVALSMSAWFPDWKYLGQEISTWRAGELQSLAVNARTVADDRIKKQQWDLFVRGPRGFEAYRVQAKTLADFQRLHPGFIRHWALASFGQSWIQDYRAAPPERRPDLDLPASSVAPGLRSPLALAFYWSRFLSPVAGVAPVFLPGFKRNARTELDFGPALQGEGWQRRQAPLRHPGLGRAPSSVAAWVSPDHYLLQLAFDVHASAGSGEAVIRALGCQGIRVAPVSATR
jgi:hypothetical protein